MMLKEMKAYGHMKPGQKGTQRLVNRLELWVSFGAIRGDTTLMERIMRE